MKFQDIFKETGLYTCKDFREGTALKISRSLIDNSLELSLVDYDVKSKAVTFIHRDFRVFDRLFDKDYFTVEVV